MNECSTIDTTNSVESRDPELRQVALNAAVCTRISGELPAGIVANAEKFLAFLKGEKSA